MGEELPGRFLPLGDVWCNPIPVALEMERIGQQQPAIRKLECRDDITPWRGSGNIALPILRPCLICNETGGNALILWKVEMADDIHLQTGDHAHQLFDRIPVMDLLHDQDVRFELDQCLLRGLHVPGLLFGRGVLLLAGEPFEVPSDHTDVVGLGKGVGGHPKCTTSGHLKVHHFWA